MLKSVSRRLGFLHDDPEADKAIARWLCADGPLGDLFSRGKVGLEIVTNIAPVAPEAVLAKISVELRSPNGARVLSVKNHERGRWLSLIKTLGYDAALFEAAAFALARFVAVEPEGHNYNSATRHLGELFQLHLSGTQATAVMRREVLRKMASSDEVGVRAGALQALDSLLEASHFSSLTLHDFGARPRDFGWQPKTYGDIWDWYNEGVRLAVELNVILPAARKVLADNVRGIWTHHRCQDALEAASIELTRDGPWIDGWIGFRQAQTYDGAGMPDDVKSKLRGIVDRLKPIDLLNRSRAIVLARSSGGFEIVEGGASNSVAAWHLADQQAVDIGKAFANEPELLAKFLPELFSERSPHRAFHFGKGVAEGAVDIADLWNTLLAAFKKLPLDRRNATTLGGYIHGAAANPGFVATALDGVANDPDVARELTYLQGRAGIDRDGIARLSAALDSGKIETSSFCQLASGVVGNSPADALAGLITKLAMLPSGSAIALDILHMNFACAKSEGREYDPELIHCGRNILSTASFEGGTSLDDYAVGEVVAVCLTDADGEEAARNICRKVRDDLDSFKLSVYQISHLLKAIFAVQPKIALDTFLAGGEHGRNISLERRLPLKDVDFAILCEWADDDPKKRYPLAGEVMSIFEVDNLDIATGLSPNFLTLMERAPDRAAFLGGAYNRLYPNGWSGSLAAVLERRRAMIEEFATHHDPAVRDWLKALDAWLPTAINEERQREAERDERFE